MPGLRLSAGVQNLFDAAYTEHLNRAVAMAMPRQRLLMPGRNVLVTASYELR
jgi:outer membrane receptor protein involved in Fe transport